MFGLGHTELIIILVIGMVIFGAKKLPDIGSGMGSAIKNFKKGISSMDKEIIALFHEVLLICDEMGLIGREMFAVDGCKLPSNASKGWSGTRDDFKKKCTKLEAAIERIVKRHRESDLTQAQESVKETEEQYISTLTKQVKKIKDWLDDNDDKPGRMGTPTK